MKRILISLLIFSLGAAGGMWAQAFLLPYAATQPLYKDREFIKMWNSRVTVIREVEEIIINQDNAIERAIAENRNAVVGVRSRLGNSIREGSGFSITSDGLIVTLATLVPQGYEVTIVAKNGDDFTIAQVIKRDIKNNLALLSVEKNGFQTTSYADARDIRLGMPVFLVGKIFEGGELITIANQGIIKATDSEMIRTNIFESSVLEGSPLFDIEGRVVGLNTVDRQGKVAAISSSVIHEFSGL